MPAHDPQASTRSCPPTSARGSRAAGAQEITEHGHHALRPGPRPPGLLPDNFTYDLSVTAPATATAPSRTSCSRPSGATASSSPAPSRRWPGRSGCPPGWRWASPPVSSTRATRPSTTSTASTPTPGPRCTSTGAGWVPSSRRPGRGTPGAAGLHGRAGARPQPATRAPPTTLGAVHHRADHDHPSTIPAPVASLAAGQRHPAAGGGGSLVTRFAVEARPAVRRRPARRAAAVRARRAGRPRRARRRRRRQRAGTPRQRIAARLDRGHRARPWSASGNGPSDTYAEQADASRRPSHRPGRPTPRRAGEPAEFWPAGAAVPRSWPRDRRAPRSAREARAASAPRRSAGGSTPVTAAGLAASSRQHPAPDHDGGDRGPRAPSGSWSTRTGARPAASRRGRLARPRSRRKRSRIRLAARSRGVAQAGGPHRPVSCSHARPGRACAGCARRQGRGEHHDEAGEGEEVAAWPA